MDWTKQVMDKYQAAIDVYTKGPPAATDDCGGAMLGQPVRDLSMVNYGGLG